MNYIPLHNPQTNTFWRVKIDPVYRLIDNRQWLDNFFNDGEILLSCFSNFINYPDEFQGDSREGDGLAFFSLDNGDSIGLKYEGGYDAYILCTTKQFNQRVIDDFKAVGAIKILNTIGFSYEIAQAIQNFTNGLEGSCIYDDSRVFNLANDKFLKDQYKGKDSLTQQKFREEFRLRTSDREMFLKHTKYNYQNEYRLIWYVNRAVQQSLILKCPAIIELCERIDF